MNGIGAEGTGLKRGNGERSVADGPHRDLGDDDAASVVIHTLTPWGHRDIDAVMLTVQGCTRGRRSSSTR